MQTFLTHTNYVDTARALDTKRLGKQRVEAYQILKALAGEYDQTGAWVNHPATRMWRGYRYELALYGLTISIEFFERGYDGMNMVDIFTNQMVMLDSENRESYPWWITNPDFLLSHQSNLVRKLPDYYSAQFPDVPSDVPYLWPLDDEQAFCLGSLYKNGDTLKIGNNGVVYMTSTQVAEYLGISPKTISAYKSRGQMPEPDRTYGRTPLWRKDTIDQWRVTVGR